MVELLATYVSDGRTIEMKNNKDCCKLQVKTILKQCRLRRVEEGTINPTATIPICELYS